MKTFYQFLRNLIEAGEAPPPPPGGAGGADPMGGAGGPPPPGGDPMGGGAGAPGAAGPRKAIHVTTWEDALRVALGHAAHRPAQSPEHKSTSDRDKGEKDASKKPKSLMQ